MVDYKKLRSEIEDDPLRRGDNGMEDRAITDSLHAEDRERTTYLVTAGQLLNSLDITEYDALDSVDKAKVNVLLSMAEAFDIGAGTNARGWLDDAFTPGSTTIANLTASKISRQEELGLGNVLVGHIADARRFG